MDANTVINMATDGSQLNATGIAQLNQVTALLNSQITSIKLPDVLNAINAYINSSKAGIDLTQLMKNMTGVLNVSVHDHEWSESF